MNTQNGDYFTPENGNGHHEKVFRLAPVQSPEEARHEVLKDIAPKIRRKVREDLRLSGGAKFFFTALLDDCFWHQVGGHGTGRIFDSLKNISARYKHDRDTISRWRDELVDAGWLFFRDEWPLAEWRLTPLMAPPENSPHHRAVQMSLGQAAKATGDANGEQSGKMPLCPPKEAKPQNAAGKGGGTPRAKRHNAAGSAASYRTQSGIMPQARRHNAAGLGGKMPQSVRQDAAAQAVQCHTFDPQNAAERAASYRIDRANQPSPVGQNVPRENTPGVGSQGALEGGGGKPPPDSRQDPEKIEWNGRAWWPSQLHKQLALVEGAIKETAGDERRRAKNLRKSLLVALGIPVPSPSSPASASASSPPPMKAAAPCAAELSKYITSLREAVK